MNVSNIHVSESSGFSILAATVVFESVARPPYELYFRFPSFLPILPRGDAFLGSCLLVCMSLGEDLFIEGDVSPRLLKASEQLQDIFIRWMPQAKRVRISCAERGLERTAGNKIGCFFSLGVDSFFTLLSEKSSRNRWALKPDYLLFVHGFDIKVSNKALFEVVAMHLQEVSKQLETELILIESNLRPFGDICLSWGGHFFGAALASVGLALGNILGTVLIPSSMAYDELFPWGSHPLTDPLWSTERTEIIHHGSQANRAEKIEQVISASDIALKHLRVCFENADNMYNCCRCEKCVRTMLSLYGVGVLQRCEAFTLPLLSQHIKSLDLDHFKLTFALENLALLKSLERTKDNTHLISALEQAIRRGKIKSTLKSLRELCWKNLSSR